MKLRREFRETQSTIRILGRLLELIGPKALIRELENFIERSVILTRGSVLVMPSVELRPTTVDVKAADDSLSSAEREHILRALRQSHCQIGGLKGAAMRLGLKRTTLQSKLKHLGINPRQGPLEHH